eukprot:CAMPEP_0115005768 /NCGR_PEP_ID=MMETSP0216-20121206/20086_1 /TAXON_ID=223996 /ORGANISM="Protocruzia adherens, Strain Boccale" /LENGTH=1013 /DNA_ID=CAMNT_0002372193 /DNA_START=50 /DNA_END=3091 /DNA_ORIENTATION=-
MARSPMLLTVVALATVLLGAQAMNFHSWGEFSTSNSTGYDKEKLNIHMLSHTHDDMGWLKTVDQYFYGDKNDIQHAGVQYILDTVVRALADNPQRRFVYVEMGFFKRWWDEQDDVIRSLVRGLIKNGQLEFANAGWTMNDESDIYYEDIITNMSLGHEFLLKEFGIRPRVAWHIDPFGHQASQAAIFAQMGFDAFFFSRIDYQDRAKRIADKTMEMVWRPETPFGKDAEIFTSVMYDNYCTPPGFCFDQGCDDTPMKTDHRLEGFNADQRAADFVKIAKERAEAYPTNNVLITMGCDFQFENAFENFKNIDKLIDYVRLLYGDEVNIFYSTPQTYVDYIKKSQYKFTVKTDDFEPYADRVDAYWSGYYTSRVAQKGYISDLSKFYAGAHTLATISLLNRAVQEGGFKGKSLSSFDSILTSYRDLFEALSLNTHHDAVSGTEKQHVCDDYMKRLYRGEVVADEFVKRLLAERHMTLAGSESHPEFQRCNLNRTSTECDVVNSLTSSNSLLLTVFNPSRDSTHVVRAKVPNKDVNVFDVKGVKLDADVICEQTQVIDTIKPDDVVTDCNLYLVDTFNPHEIKNYVIKTISQESNYFDWWLKQTNPTTKTTTTTDDDTITNSLYTLSFDKTTGDFTTLTACTASNTCETTPFTIDFHQYHSMQNSSQNSGAYIFRPDNETFDKTLPYRGDLLHAEVYKGSSIEQVTFDYSNIKVKARLFKQSGLPLELEVLVKPIDVSDGNGHEIVAVYGSDIENDKTFYTDSCGLYMQKRVVDYRPTWHLQVNQPRAGNFYPIRNAIYIQQKDGNKRLTVNTDRSQGAASIDDGKMEVMIHRRLLQDDARGVGEPLNETAYGRGLQTMFRHYVSLESLEIGTSDLQRTIQRRLDEQPLVYYSIVDNGVEMNDSQEEYSMDPTTSQLMGNVGQDVKVGFRIMDHPIFGKGLIIIFSNLSENESEFNFRLASKSRRLTLSFNQDWDEMMAEKYHWLSQGESVASEIPESDANVLKALEVRIYFISFD